MEINFDEQDRSEIENADIPLENDVTLSLRPTQIPFTIEITHATITDALNRNLFNLTDFLNTDFTDIVHASPGKISYAVVVIMLIMEHIYCVHTWHGCPSRHGTITTVPAPVHTARNATVLNYVIPN